MSRNSRRTRERSINFSRVSNLRVTVDKATIVIYAISEGDILKSASLEKGRSYTIMAPGLQERLPRAEFRGVRSKGLTFRLPNKKAETFIKLDGQTLAMRILAPAWNLSVDAALLRENVIQLLHEAQAAHNKPGSRLSELKLTAVVASLNQQVPGIEARAEIQVNSEHGTYHMTKVKADKQGTLSTYASVINNVQVLQCSSCGHCCERKYLMEEHLKRHQKDEQQQLTCMTAEATAQSAAEVSSMETDRCKDAPAPDPLEGCFKPSHIEW
eukprot:jgi/Ulvmu1/1253/UM109_0051.1